MSILSVMVHHRRRMLRVRFTAALAGLVMIAAASPTSALAGTAYVTNENSSSVTPINTATNSAGTPITVGSDPVGVAITPNGKTAYVTLIGSGTVVPINISAGTAGTPITVGGAPFGIAITPNGQTAYVGSNGTNTVTPINIATNTPGTPINVGQLPENIAITPNGQTAYVASVAAGTITPINIATNTAGTPIDIGGNPEAIEITPNGQTAYVGDGNYVDPVDLATGTVGTPIVVETASPGIAISPATTTAYVSDGGANRLDLIDTATNALGAPISVGSTTGDLALTPDGATAYVITPNDTVTPVNTATAAVGAAITVGSSPQRIAVVPDQAPTAAFAATSAAPGTASSFNGSESSDPDTSVASYSWSFGDGTTTTMSSSTVSHTYSAAGSYTVRLTVTGANGCSTSVIFTGQTAYCNGSTSAQISHIVTVPTTPVAAIASPVAGHTYRRGQPVKTSFSCTEASGGPGLASCVDSNAANASVGHLNTRTVGAHIYTVTAVSKDGLSSSKTVAYNVVGLTIKSTALVLSKGTARVKLACSGAKGSLCTGTLAFSVRVKVHRRSRALMLGSAALRVEAGRTAEISVKLNRSGRSRFAAAHHRLTVTATATIDGGQAAARKLRLNG
jgi:YVTN family beta-propeller protein